MGKYAPPRLESRSSDAKLNLAAQHQKLKLQGKLHHHSTVTNMPPSKRKSAAGHATRHHNIPKNHCFGCGPDNPDGMKLKFYLDEPRKTFVCRFKLSNRYVGPPGHAHGGVIATILDEAMGKVNKLRHVIALTKEMHIEYVRPVPLGKTLVVEGHERSVRGRVHTNFAEIRNERGEVLARSRGKFIAVDPEKMFKKYLKNGVRSGPLAAMPRPR